MIVIIHDHASTVKGTHLMRDTCKLSEIPEHLRVYFEPVKGEGGVAANSHPT